MKQLVQHVRTGQTVVTDVPAPGAGAGRVLVHVGASLVSAGTERMVVEFASKSLVDKARSRPDLVRQVLEKAEREGVLPTLDAVRNRLDQPMALGYSCAGTVLAAGEGVEGLRAGDRVACAGGGYAVHAEVVSVPRNLVVRLPGSVAFEAGAFTTLGAIALQGIRLADLQLGAVAAVIGLGLLGQLTVQMLKAAGCVVVGMDPQAARAELARVCGADVVATDAEQLAALCAERSGGHGADAVLITADTKSNEPVEVAGAVARERAIVVAVGAVGMAIPRKVYYEKELDFRISRSYGPGRYDPAYEEGGQDYPYGYVRWTEQRNMEAFARLLAEGKVDVAPLITHRFPIADAAGAYNLITGKAGEPFLGVLLTYPEQPDLSRRVELPGVAPSRAQRPPKLWGVGGAVTQRPAEPPGVAPSPSGSPPGFGGVGGADTVRLGVIGAGNFANATLLPALKGLPDLELVGIASAGGLTARSAADRHKFAFCTTDAQEILGDTRVNTVAVLTRHHLHARQVIAALEAGKHVFVEKPLCLTPGELAEVRAAHASAVSRAESQGVAPPVLMVGFNRRFAPFVAALREQLRHVSEPLVLHCRANAGYIPPDHWTQDPSQGGGRLLGEACHFIDLLLFLAGQRVCQVTTRALPDAGRYRSDNLLITLAFADGSLGTVAYVANGDKGFGKECLEVFGGGLSARMEDYRLLQIRRGGTRVRQTARLRPDKGHRAEWQALIAHLTGRGPAPIAFEEIVHSTEAALAAQESLRAGAPVTVGAEPGA